MVTIPQPAWAFWFSLIITGIMAAQAAVCAYVYYLMPKGHRSDMIALSALLFAAIAGGLGCLTLIAGGFQPVRWPWFAQWFFWALVTTSSMILVDLGLARLNSHAAQVYRILHWWGKAPKDKIGVYLILFATLYMMVN